MLFLRMFNDDLAHPQTQWEIPKVYLRDSGPCVLNKWWMVMMIWPRIPARWMWVPALISLWCIPGFSIDVPMVWYMLCIYIYRCQCIHIFTELCVFLQICVHVYICIYIYILYPFLLMDIPISLFFVPNLSLFKVCLPPTNQLNLLLATIPVVGWRNYNLWVTDTHIYIIYNI